MRGLDVLRLDVWYWINADTQTCTAPVCGHEHGTVIGEGEREMQTSH